MIKFRFLQFWLLLLFIGISPNFTSAQITYSSNGIINIGGAQENGRFNLLIDKYSGLFWTFNNSTKFFQIDVSSANPRLAGTGNELVLYNTITSEFNSLQLSEAYFYSDARAKTNIKSIGNGLNTILNLRPVSYNWKGYEVGGNKRSKEKPSNKEKMQYGFLAQEVEEILPDAVITDDDGRKLINYNAIIPLLVQSVQELQCTVNNQATIIDNLSAQIENNNINNIITNKIINCSPNPSNGFISFEYVVDENAITNIFISDLIGNIKETINCDINSNKVSIDLSNFNNGIYIASLSVNNIVKDSRQFIIQK